MKTVAIGATAVAFLLLLSYEPPENVYKMRSYYEVIGARCATNADAAPYVMPVVTYTFYNRQDARIAYYTLRAHCDLGTFVSMSNDGKLVVEERYDFRIRDDATFWTREDTEGL